VLCGGWKAKYGFEFLGNHFRYLTSYDSWKYYVFLSGVIRESSSSFLGNHIEIDIVKGFSNICAYPITNVDMSFQSIGIKRAV